MADLCIVLAVVQVQAFHCGNNDLCVQSPLDPGSDEVIAELAAGMGETLASGAQGVPWRLAISKSSGEPARCLVKPRRGLIKASASPNSAR